MTKSDLAQGMSAKAEKAYTDLADRDFSSSLSTILKGGGNLNDVGSVYGNKESGRQQLALLKDNLRLQQIQNEVAASKSVSQRNDEQFLYNTDAPWKDAAQANAGAKKDAEASIWSGLQTIGSAAMQFGQQKSEANLYDKYFGVPKNTSTNTGLSGRADYPEIERPSTTSTTTQRPDTIENPYQNSGTENEQLYNYLFPNRKI